MQSNPDFSELFNQTLEQAIDSVVVIDTDNRVIFFNRAAEQLWGYSREEVIGKNVKMLVPSEIQSHHDHYIDTNRQTGVNHIVGTFRTVPIHCKDGSRCWGSMSISKVESAGKILYTAFIKDVTDQHEAEEHARLLSLVADQTDNAIIITNGQWEIVYVNAGFSRMFGYTFEKVQGQYPTSVLTPNVEQSTVEKIQQRLSQGRAFNAEEITYMAGGERMWCSVTSNPVFDAAGNLRNTVSVLTDITHSKMHEVLQHRVLEAMAKEEPLEDIMDLVCREIERIVPEVVTSILRVDGNHTLRPLASPSLPASYCLAIEGLPIGEGVASSGTAAYRGEEVIVSDIENDPLWTHYKALVLPLSLNSCWVTPIKGSHERILGTLAFYRTEFRTPTTFDRQLVDVIVPLCALALEREESRAHIRQLAFYDNLTELPNRSLLLAEAERALHEAQRQKTGLAVFFIDLDRFKQVNDTLGHPAGDKLLQIIAERLQQSRRHTDIVGRLSGDEFVVVLPQCDREHVVEIVEQLRLSMSQPCLVGGVMLAPSASIGISVFPHDGHDMGTLIHRADMAMYQAKSAGRGRYSFFSHELNQLTQERQALESALRSTLENNQLQLYYQPQISMEGGYLYGVEALARWHHPELGIISPVRFIALAEECGLIGELGQWGIKEACRQLAIWRRQGIHIPVVSVNLSPTNFHNLDLPGMIMHTLKEHDLDVKDLTIEITENILVDTNPSIMKTISEVHAYGIRLSVDDFGTGYSSLSYLRRFPIQELKLDSSFVKDLEYDHTSRALSAAVIRIGESLQLTVVAEGIETDQQHAILKEQGYHVAQGYLFSQPLPATDFEKWVTDALIAGKITNKVST